MHSNLFGACIALLFSIYSANTAKVDKQNINSRILKETFQEIQYYQQLDQDITVVDLKGNQYKNPTLSTLQSLSPDLLSENRIRLTLNNNSEDNRCSTEIVLLNENGGIEGNYSLNTCSSYGWIFFTPAICFDIDLYHDAGLEAPTGNKIKGSVDWTFSFNQEERLSGTYYDGGAANMLRVASPCYKEDRFTYTPSNRERLARLPQRKE